MIRSPSEGIVCTVDGLSSVWELPLAEIGVRGGDPNCQLIDDYAFWFLNGRRLGAALPPLAQVHVVDNVMLFAEQ